MKVIMVLLMNIAKENQTEAGQAGEEQYCLQCKHKPVLLPKHRFEGDVFSAYASCLLTFTVQSLSSEIHPFSGMHLFPFRAVPWQI